MELTHPTPDDLGPGGRELFEGVTQHFELGAHELAQLHQAARIRDRLDRIQAELEAASFVSRNRHGETVAHPLIAEARASSLAMTTILKSLKIPQGDEDAPPRRGGNKIHVIRRA